MLWFCRGVLTMNYGRKIIFLILLLTTISTTIDAQRFTRQDMAFGGKNFYGFAMNNNPYRKSNGYMTYDVEVGFQTMPSDSCVYVRSYGYPILSVGISVCMIWVCVKCRGVGPAETQASPLPSSPHPRLLFAPHRPVLPFQLHFPVPASLAAREAAIHV